MQMCLPGSTIQPVSVRCRDEAQQGCFQAAGQVGSRWHCAARHVLPHLSGEVPPPPGVHGPNSSGDWLAGGPARGVMVGPSGTAS